MLYIPLLIVCSLNPGLISNSDTGPTCVIYRDAAQTGYPSLRQCKERVGQIVREVKEDAAILKRTIPGPYEFRGKCAVPANEARGLV